MGRIPIPRHQLGPPAKAATAKSPWPERMTRHRRAMAGFGESLAVLGENLAFRFLEARVNSEFTEGKALWTQRHDEFIRSLKDEQDYKSIPKKYEKFSTELQKEVSGLASTERARTGLKNWMVEEAPKQNRQISFIALAKEQDYMRASTLNAVDVHIKDGNAPAATAALIRARNSGYFSAEEVERRIQTIARETDWNAGIEALEADPVSFLKDIDDKDYLESLDAESRSQLKRKARTQMGLELAFQKEARENEINTEQGRLMQLARKGQLTDDVIRTSNLDEFGTGSKSTFYGILDAWADAALKNKEAPFKESTPEVEAQILDQIRDPRSEITPKDISDLVGKGLSIDDADRFINRLDVYKGFWFGRADRFLKDQLGWSDTYTKFMHPEGAISYHAAMNQLFTDIEVQGLKDKDIYERAIEKGIPYIVDYWENVLSLEKPQIERMKLLLTGKTVTPKKKEPVGPLREPKEEIKLEFDPLGIFK